MSSSATPHVETGLLLLADISGYTAFLEAVAVAHPEMTLGGGEVPPAYPLLSSLLDVVADRIGPTFTVSDIEGDAVFAYAPDDRLADGSDDFLGIIRSTYGAFRERIQEAVVLQNHDCNACIILPTLELKFVVHHGMLVVQTIYGHERLLGPAVIVAHRLLKNSVTEQTGRRAYLLLTDAAAQRLGLPDGIGQAHEERYPDVGSISGVVVGLEAAAPSDAR